MIPIAIGAARLWGEKLGFYGLEAGVALAAVGNVLVMSALLITSILALYRSDTIRKEREDALRRSEHFNRTINEASPDCVSLLDLDGRVVFSNDAAVRAYGLESAAELIGRPWDHRLDERHRAEADAALEAARAGGVGRLTLQLRGSTGDQRWFESLVSKLSNGDGQPISFIVMSRDITHQKEVEDQVRWAPLTTRSHGFPTARCSRPGWTRSAKPPTGRTSPCWCSTLTTSSWSTTRLATMQATRCSPPSASGSGGRWASRILSPASAATSSR